MLDAVLKSIDDNIGASLDRLFQLLRIDSISTDPAYRDSCRRAADWLVGELAGIGSTPPLRAGLTADAGGGGRLADRPAGPDPIGQEPATPWGQPGVRMRH